MIAALLLMGATAMADSVCSGLEPLEGQTQVVWVSPTHESADSRRYLEVVELSDLQEWIGRSRPDKVRVLERLGLVPQGGGLRSNLEWKVTIFDVVPDDLCRPVRGALPGASVQGVAACEEDLQRGGPRFTGCGYTLDTATDSKGFDAFRVRWMEASKWGFCVMPLERLLQNR